MFLHILCEQAYIPNHLQINERYKQGNFALSHNLLSNLPTDRPKAYRTLDAWRGFAALWVVLAHSCLSTPFSQVSSFVNQVQKFYLFNLAGYLGVQMFFVISGYCIAASIISSMEKNHGPVTFMKARLKRIYPPYFYALILTVFYSLIISFIARWLPLFARSISTNLHFFAQPFLFYLSNFSLTNRPLHEYAIIPVSWTLNYEVAFYGIMGLTLMALFKQRNKNTLLNYLHLLTIITLFMLIIKPNGILFPLDLWPQFGLGVLAFDLLNQPRRGFSRAAFILIIVEIFIYAFEYSHVGGATVYEHWRHSSFPSRVLFSLVFFCILLVLYRHDEALSNLSAVRFLAWIGGFSYTLYLTHFICVNFISIIGDMLGVSVATFPIIYFAKVSCAIGLAYLLYPFIEKPFLHTKGRMEVKTAALISITENASKC